MMKEENSQKENHSKEEIYIRIKEMTRYKMLHEKALKTFIARIESNYRFFRVMMNFALVFLTTIMASFATMSIIDGGSFIEKKVLQEDIANVVKNDGDLRAIKQALLNQPNVSGFKILFSSKKDYYRDSVALSTVLDDVRLQAYRSGDKSHLPKLEPIINEYEETNPFDKLQTGQKDYFENIRIKTGVEYQKINNDVNNLADELYQQNRLVDEYLSDSKMSFWISVVALSLSLLIGGYQIFSNRPEAMRRILLEILNDDIGEINESSNKANTADVKSSTAD